MPLITTSYTEQKTRLREIGRYILAQFDGEGVIVYQARPEIGHFAVNQDKHHRGMLSILTFECNCLAALAQTLPVPVRDFG